MSFQIFFLCSHLNLLASILQPLVCCHSVQSCQHDSRDFQKFQRFWNLKVVQFLGRPINCLVYLMQELFQTQLCRLHCRVFLSFLRCHLTLTDHMPVFFSLCILEIFPLVLGLKVLLCLTFYFHFCFADIENVLGICILLGCGLSRCLHLGLYHNFLSKKASVFQVHFMDSFCWKWMLVMQRLYLEWNSISGSPLSFLPSQPYLHITSLEHVFFSPNLIFQSFIITFTSSFGIKLNVDSRLLQNWFISSSKLLNI